MVLIIRMVLLCILLWYVTCFCVFVVGFGAYDNTTSKPHISGTDLRSMLVSDLLRLKMVLMLTFGRAESKPKPEP